MKDHESDALSQYIDQQFDWLGIPQKNSSNNEDNILSYVESLFPQLKTSLSQEEEEETFTSKEVILKSEELLVLEKYVASILDTVPQETTPMHREESGCGIVLDTNTYMLQPRSVLKLMKYGNFTVIIPQSVVKELDSLKIRQEIGHIARKWNKFMDKETRLHSEGKASEWNVRFQNSEEYQQAEKIYQNTKADDRIISCAQYFNRNRHLVPLNTLSEKPTPLNGSLPKSVVLVTNDRNMATVARMRNVKVMMIEDLVQDQSSAK
jgi:rRNA-processing protein FCF1